MYMGSHPPPSCPAAPRSPLLGPRRGSPLLVMNINKLPFPAKVHPLWKPKRYPALHLYIAAVSLTLCCLYMFERRTLPTPFAPPANQFPVSTRSCSNNAPFLSRLRMQNPSEPAEESFDPLFYQNTTYERMLGPA
jgi:hypothetical protein